MNSFHLEISFKDELEASLIYKALLPEFKRGFPSIKNHSISLRNNVISIDIESDRISRLRAIANTVIRWLISIEEINDMVKDESTTTT